MTKKICIAVAMLIVLAGCQTPKKRVFMAHKSYTSASRLATTARKVGRVDDVTWEKVKAADAVVWAYLEAYKDAVAGGEKGSAELRAFNAALDEMILLYSVSLGDK